MGASGLLHDEAALGDGLELIRRQQGALHHLQALAGIVFLAAHRAGEHRGHDGCHRSSVIMWLDDDCY